MFNEVFVNFNNRMFMDFIEEVQRKKNLHGNSKEIADMMIDCLMEEAKKRKHNNQCAFGFNDEQLEKAVVKAFALYPQYKKMKEKNSLPKNQTKGDVYFDKNGQKHKKQTKTETKKEVKKEVKKETKGEDEFDLTQLELFEL